MKKWTYILIGTILTLLLVGFLMFGNSDNTKTPDNTKSLYTYSKSEYTKCIEASLDRTCEINYLKELGYEDGVDCIMDYSNPICDFDRYNADVEASNSCFGKKPNMFDCAALVR